MIFTWDWHNSCIIYKWWHVTTFPGFLGTLVALVVLSMLYEYLRVRISRWRQKHVTGAGIASPAARTLSAVRVRLALLYGVQVGYSFMLMLVFMTYNGWYMMAVVAGAGLGFYLWGDEADTRAMVCH